MCFVIEMKFAENQKIDEHVLPASIKCFTEKEMKDESARNASQLRMNTYVYSYTLRTGNSLIPCWLEKKRLDTF